VKFQEQEYPLREIPVFFLAVMKISIYKKDLHVMPLSSAVRGKLAGTTNKKGGAGNGIKHITGGYWKRSCGIPAQGKSKGASG
jgi:hypothetical protein